ncbi:hypothetical protein ACN6A1_10345 [Myxococcus virescens]
MADALPVHQNWSTATRHFRALLEFAKLCDVKPKDDLHSAEAASLSGHSV